MDSIHDPNGRPWISKPVKVEQYFQEFSEVISSENIQGKVRNSRDTKWLKKSIGLEDNSEVFSRIEEVMQVENLTIDGEVEPMQIADPILDRIHGFSISLFKKTPISVEAAGKLKTLALQTEWLRRTKNNLKTELMRYTLISNGQSKHKNDHWFQSEKPPATYKDWNLIDKAVVFCARIYRPFKQKIGQFPFNSGAIPYSQEIWLLGHHTLADLRDRVWCPADLNVVGSQQVDTVDSPALRAKDIYKSSMVYMEGTFYVDRRSSNYLDYSEQIRHWAKDPKKRVGPFKTDTMETTRLDSLTIRLGYPYVYQHQGSHEHLISFIDVRLLDPTDPQSVQEYPLIRSLGIQKSVYCMICETNIAVWVTMDNVRVPKDPYYFCGLCYKKFNFVDKKRVGSYKEYRYFDVNTI